MEAPSNSHDYSRNPREFTFDNVFATTALQEEIYE